MVPFDQQNKTCMFNLEKCNEFDNFYIFILYTNIVTDKKKKKIEFILFIYGLTLYSLNNR
jgi:hypothetical protein